MVVLDREHTLAKLLYRHHPPARRTQHSMYDDSLLRLLPELPVSSNVGLDKRAATNQNQNRSSRSRALHA